MTIQDLRQLSARQISPLLSEEAALWKQELRWDYRPSHDLIKKFMDSKSLAGCVAMEDGQPVGYAFYVIEDYKGLLGGLYCSSRYPQLPMARSLLASSIETLRAIPAIERIEAQLVPFGAKFDNALAEQGFRLFDRQFMLLDLSAGRTSDSHGNGSGPPAGSSSVGSSASTRDATAAAGAGLILEPWDNRHFAACARLIQLAYANHVDGEINDQYRSEQGALKFLKNIIVLPGCGQFVPPSSFVLRAPQSYDLAGVVLISCVAPGVAHATQICVMPGYQRNGLGRRMIESAVGVLRARHFNALSLTVTSSNYPAVTLYEDIGFRIIKRFTAGVWRADGCRANVFPGSSS